MAKATAPLLSFDAAGQIGQTMVASRWRGVQYWRRYVIPANPQTTAQQQTRGIFSMLNGFWLRAPALIVAPWFLYATGRPFTDRNAFIGQNLSLLRKPTVATDMQALIGSPGAKGGIPPTSVSAAAGVEQAVVTIGLPAEPPDWTIAASVAAAFIDQDPLDPFPTVIAANRETAAPETNTITGLVATELYVVMAWLEWTRPDGTVAYSISLNDTVTPTA
jgi:hypothetical protein